MFELGGALAVVRSEVSTGVVDVPAVEPVVDYVDSMRSLYGRGLPVESWSDLLAAVRVRVARVIAERGVWSTRRRVGVLECRPA